MLSNSIGQNEKLGRSSVVAIRGDGRSDLGYGGVEVDVVGERDFDDAVHAVGRQGANSVARFGPVEGDDVLDSRVVDHRHIAAAPNGPDHGCTRPAGELRGQRADTAEHAVHQDRRSSNRAVARTPPGGR